MEKNMQSDQVGEQQKKAYQEGIKRAYESSANIGKLNDERYTECRRLWKEYLAGKLTAAELEQCVAKYNYKVATLKEVSWLVEAFDGRVIDK